MAELGELRAAELDALREVATIGAGHAATALSQLTGRRVMIEVPQVLIPRFEEIPGLVAGPDEIVCAVVMQVLGDLTGRTAVAFRQPAAATLADLLLGREPGGNHPFGPAEESALKETTNILGGAYLSALSEFLGLMLLPSVPSLAMDTPEAVFTRARLEIDDGVEEVISIESSFVVNGLESELTGEFFLLPDPPAVDVIFNALRLA